MKKFLTKQFGFLLWLCLLLLTQLSWANSALPTRGLVGARLVQQGNTTQVTFEFETHFHYKIQFLPKLSKVILTMPHVVLKTNLDELPLTKSIIESIQSSESKDKTLKMVFKLKNHANLHYLSLNPKGNFSYRLVLKFTGQFKHAKKTPVPIYESKDSVHGKPVEGRDIIIVVDPGHGGKDPGATGPKGIHEKNVVLAISKDIQNDINAIPGMVAKLTRTGDYYLTLRDRLKVARKDDADFFVAIHADAFHDKNATGASVFALSQSGATSEAARWLAENENYSELGGVNLTDKSRVLRSVLIDLSQTATIRQSLMAGDTIVKHLQSVTPMHSSKVEQARFVVLKSPDIPSLLIETGFISNPKQEHLLNSVWYRHALARSITAGIEGYFWAYPPPHTLFDLKKEARHFTVKQGSTLYSIAKHYGTSVKLIKRMNNLSSNLLKKGQVLMVPSTPTNNQ